MSTFCLFWAVWTLSTFQLLLIFARYQNPSAEILAKLIVLVSIGICIIRELFVKHSNRERYWSPLAREILRKHPRIKSFKNSGISLMLLLASASIISALYFGATFGMTALAMAIDQTGFHELAERVYRVSPERDIFVCRCDAPYLTLASWKSVHMTENPKEAESRNRAVAEVYGPESVQMAYRYSYIGRALDCADRKQEAVPYHRTALFLFEQNGRPEATISSLAYIASSSEDPYAELYFGLALKRLQHIDDLNADEFDLLSLADTARRLKRQDLVDYLTERGRKAHERQEFIHHQRMNLLGKLDECLFPLIAIYISLLLGRALLLRRLEKEWIKEDSLDSLNKLTVLALYRGRLDVADAYSERMLARARKLI